jgi:DNA adenine methylase
MVGVGDVDIASIVNVASVPQRSPFRYPGGKTWLVPLVRSWLSAVQPVVDLVEPFAGGAIVGLTAVFERLAEHVTLIELDPNVAAVWEVLLDGQGSSLAEKIVAFDMTLENARRILAQEPQSVLDRAFATIVRNRVQRGGILAPGASLMKAGENGHGVKSRWYAGTLHRRISDIQGRRSRIASHSFAATVSPICATSLAAAERLISLTLPTRLPGQEIAAP